MKIVRNTIMGSKCIFWIGLVLTNCVFVGTEEVTAVEGQSVTLHTGVQEYYQINWRFGPQGGIIAQCRENPNETPSCEIYSFRDSLQIDNQTGSLTISNISTELQIYLQSKIYNLQIINKSKNSAQKEFNVSVSAALPIPKIVKDSKRSSCSKCVLRCSVMNVTQATLSWYEGNCLISSIPVSGLNSSSFLLQELNYQDVNNYSCVVNNSVSNQTEQLNINELCPPCSEPGLGSGCIVLICVGLLVLVLVGVSVVIYRNCRKERLREVACRYEKNRGIVSSLININEEP